MGVTLSYQAIPPTSNFYRRAMQEKPLYTLLVSLFPYRCGTFSFFDINPLFPGDSINEINESIEDVLKEHQDIFGSELEASLAVAEYRHELMLTCQEFPGIERRTASLEKTGEEVKERLSQELERRKIENYELIIEDLLYGDRIFAPSDLSTEAHTLCLVSRDAVSQGAAILRQIDPASLFSIEEEYYFDSFACWRKFYMEVDENKEEILMDVL
jgi:hypothetical protein